MKNPFRGWPPTKAFSRSRVDFSHALIGNLLYAVTQYLLLTVFIKCYSPDIVGKFVYALAFVAPLTMAFDMQLRSLYVTEKAHDSSTYYRYRNFRMISNAFALALIILGAILIKRELAFVICLVAGSKIVESQIDLTYGVMQRLGRLDKVSYSKILRGSISLGAVYLGAQLGFSLEICLTLYLVVWILIFLLHDYRYVGQIVVNARLGAFKGHELRQILVTAWPVFILVLIDRYYANYPRFLVESTMGLEQLGLFGSLLYFKVIGGQLVASLGQALAPKLASAWNSESFDQFKSLLSKMVITAFFIGVIGLVIGLIGGEFLLTFLFTSKYAPYSDILVYVLIGTTITFTYIFFSTALTCMRVHWVKIPIHLIGLLLIIILPTVLKFDFTLRSISLLIISVELIIGILYFLTFQYFISKYDKRIVL